MPRFRRVPVLRVSPSFRRESFAVPVALVGVTCIAIIAIVRALLPNERYQATGFATPDYASHLSVSVASFAADVAAPWDVSTGGGALPRHARSIRVGARIVDLEVAVRVRDMLSSAALVNQDSNSIAIRNEQSVLAARFAGEIASMFAHADGLEYLGDEFARIQRAAVDVAPLGGEVNYARRVAVADDAPILLLGNWLEAARIAAVRGDRAFFATPASIGEVESFEKPAEIGRASHAALDRVRRLLPAGKAGNLVTLGRALNSALAILGSEPG